jgi:hypothetical protein
MNLFIYYLFVTAMGYGLDGRGLFSGRGKRIFSYVKIHIGIDVHPASYPVFAGGSFPRREVAEA